MTSKSVINVRILGDNKSLKGALSESSSSIKSWAASVGKVVATAATAAGAAVAGGITKGILDANDAEANTDLLQASLGITPERAAELGQIASSVYRDAWGESLADVSDTVEGISGSFENLGLDEVDALTKRAIGLGKAFKVDTALGIQTASELVESGLAESADEAFDLLTAGLQRMPKAIRDELFAASNEYGDFFADLGFNGNETFGLLTQFAEQGVFGIDKVGDAVKELSIRATDGSTASVAAYEAIGLSADETAARMLAGGDDARSAFFDIVTGLQGIEDPVLQANSAIALFGTPLEDLSVGEIPEFLHSLHNIDTGLGNVRGSAQEMTDTLSGNNKAKIEAFRRQAFGKLADFTARHVIPRLTELGEYLRRELPPIIDRVRQWFERNWPAIRSTIESVVRWLRDDAAPVVAAVMSAIITGAGAVRAWFDENWPAIRSTIASVVDWLDAHVVPVIEAVAGFIITEFGNVRGWVDENWPKIRQTIESTVGAIRVIVETVVAAITRFWEAHGDDIVDFVTSAWRAVKDVIEGTLEVVRGIIQTVTSLIRGDWQGVWDGITAIVDGAWQAIGGIVSAALALLELGLELAWSGITAAVRAAWNGVKSLVRDAVDGVVTTVRNLPARLLSLVGDLASAGRSLGEALLNGLKNALSATAGFAGDVGRAVLDAVKSVVNRFVIDKINAALEFSVPLPFGQSVSINPPDIPRLHSGGSVGNIFGPAREVPRILETGEGVLSRDDMRELVGLNQRRSASGPVRLIVGRHEFDAYLDDRERELAGAF